MTKRTCFLGKYMNSQKKIVLNWGHVFRKAISLNRSDSQLFYERAKAAYKMGKKRRALKDLNNAVEIDPSNMEFRYTVVHSNSLKPLNYTFL